MQPKKELKVQYIGIFEEIDSFYSGNARKTTFFSIDVFPNSFVRHSKENAFSQFINYLDQHIQPQVMFAIVIFAIIGLEFYSGALHKSCYSIHNLG